MKNAYLGSLGTKSNTCYGGQDSEGCPKQVNEETEKNAVCVLKIQLQS